jgi:hypothetical protein
MKNLSTKTIIINVLFFFSIIIAIFVPLLIYSYTKEGIYLWLYLMELVFAICISSMYKY